MRPDGSGAVLLVANYPPGVGYAWWLMEDFWLQIATEMARQGRRCLLAYPRLSEEPSEALCGSSIEPVEVDFGDRSPEGRRELAELVRSYRISSIYLTDRPFLDWRYAWLRTLGVRRIVIHDHTPGDRPRIGGLKGAVKAAVIALPGITADRYIAVTEFVRRRMLSNARLPARKCFVVPNGIEPRGCDEDDRVWARGELGAEAGEVIVVLVGRAHRYKNIGFAIECASRMRDEHPELPASFVLIGDGPQLRELQAKAESAQLGTRFRFAGRRTDVRRLLCGCDIGFHPSFGEVGYSLSVLEFMDAGLPVVVSDRPSVCGSVRDGTTGRVYRAENPSSAIEALATLAGDIDKRQEMGRAARADLRDQYSSDKTQAAFKAYVAEYL